MAAQYGKGNLPGPALVTAALDRLAAEGEAAWVAWILAELATHATRIAQDRAAWEALVHGLTLGVLEDSTVRTHLQVRETCRMPAVWT